MAYDAKSIRFLNGTQAAVNGLITNGGAREGAFYLANDTQRLYIGTVVQGDKVIPKPVNQGVITVDTKENLPTANADLSGQFYYITTGTILAVCNGKEWVQINTDTTLKTSTSATTVSSITDGVKVATEVADTNNNTANGEFTLVEGAGINISADGNKITISATGSGGAKIELSVVGSEDNKTATVKQLTTVIGPDGKTTTGPTEDSYSIKAGANVDSVAVSTVDGKEVITINAGTQEVLSEDSTFTAAAEGFALSLAQTSKNTVDLSINPEVEVGKTNKSAVKFVNGKASLDVYTTAETDAAIDKAVKGELQSFDGMKYEGTVDGTKDLPAITEVGNGAVFKVAAVTPAVSAVDSKAKIGDLLIAVGTEDEETGKLTTGKYELVPSGDEPIYVGELVEHGIKIIEKADEDTQSEVVSLQLSAGKNVALTDTISADGKGRTVEVAHETITTETPATEASTAYAGKGTYQEAKTITVVKGIEVENGHVKKVITGSEEIVDSVQNLKDASVEVSDATGGVDVKSTIGIDGSETAAETTTKFVSDNPSLKITKGADAQTVKFDLVWGTF